MTDVLLTFTGFHDPYFKGLIDQEEQPGPMRRKKFVQRLLKAGI